MVSRGKLVVSRGKLVCTHRVGLGRVDDEVPEGEAEAILAAPEVETAWSSAESRAGLGLGGGGLGAPVSLKHQREVLVKHDNLTVI